MALRPLGSGEADGRSVVFLDEMETGDDVLHFETDMRAHPVPGSAS